MKQRIYGLLTLLLTLFVLPLQAADTGLLWRISASTGQASYLFGTIHSDDPRLTALPAPVSEGFDGARTVVLEMVLDPAASGEMARAMVLPPSTSLGSVVGDQLSAAAVEAMAGRGYPAEITRQLQPWAIVLTLSMPEPRSGQFMDLILYQQALAAGKRVVGLESATEQLTVFSGLDRAEQRQLLADTLRDYREYPALFARMTEAYLSRDLDTLVALSEASPLSSDAALQQKVMERLIGERNRRMAERLLPLLRDGGLFVAVGALHLAGESGLIARLRKAGYRVEAVY